LKSESGGFKYFTSADIGSYWNNLNKELEATPVNESELPGSESISQNDIVLITAKSKLVKAYEDDFEKSRNLIFTGNRRFYKYE